MICPACNKPQLKCDCFTIKPVVIKKLDGVVIHGYGGYVRGCRCQDCADGNAKYMAGYRERRKKRMAAKL